jgi:hypothetical protein
MSLKKGNKQESLERLQNQLEQAKLDGNTDLMKKIKAIMERIKDAKASKLDSYPPQRNRA